MIIIAIIRYFLGLTHRTRLPLILNRINVPPGQSSQRFPLKRGCSARILAGGWSFRRNLTGWVTEHVPISKYSESLKVVLNQTLPGTPALKFNSPCRLQKRKKIFMHEIELESKAAQIHSAVFFFLRDGIRFLHMQVSFSWAVQSLPSIQFPGTTSASVSTLTLNTHIEYSPNYSDTSRRNSRLGG